MILGLVSFILGGLSYGITDCFWKNPQSELGLLPVIIVRSGLCAIILFSLFGLSILFPNLFTLIYSPTAIDTSLFPYEVLLCMVNYFGLYFFVKSLAYSKVSETMGFNKIGLVIKILIAIFYFNESVSNQKLVACLFILVGISLIEYYTKKEKTQLLSKGFIYVLLCRIFWATGVLFLPYIKGIGVLLHCAILEIIVCIMSILLLLISTNTKGIKEAVTLPYSNHKLSIAILVVFGVIGTIGYTNALNQIPVILFAFIVMLEPLVAIFISSYFHNEKLTISQWLGIALGILGAFIYMI